MASTSNTSNSSNGEKERPPNTFNDRFEQLLLHEITPTLWLSVYRSKVLNAAVYVDIREKRERKIREREHSSPLNLAFSSVEWNLMSFKKFINHGKKDRRSPISHMKYLVKDGE